MRVLILSNDKYLIRRLELELAGKAEAVTEAESFDALIYDLECGMPKPEFYGKTVTLSRTGASGAEAIPFPHGKISELIFSGDGKRLSVNESDRAALFGDRRIKLTSHEYALLALLLAKDGYTSREEIAKKVWGDASDGLINIYVHYLREKLESDGEKVIVSSRKYGYKINEKYKEGGIC